LADSRGRTGSKGLQADEEKRGPVVDETGKAIGSIMIKDVKHLLTASDVNRDYMLVSGDLHCNLVILIQ
jgi:hypothetical protein